MNVAGFEWNQSVLPHVRNSKSRCTIVYHCCPCVDAEDKLEIIIMYSMVVAARHKPLGNISHGSKSVEIRNLDGSEVQGYPQQD